MSVDLRVDWCSYEAAKYAVEHWHYSRCMPTPPIIKIGVWENSLFVGCVLFSRGANKNIGSPYGLRCTEVAELTRVALTNHASPVSRILSKAISLLRDKEKGLRLLVSFADRNQNHHGGIYQAGNWVYAGETSSSYKFIDAGGHVWHPRQVSKTGIKPQYGELRRVPKSGDCDRIFQYGKHRYLYPLDRAMRKQIESLRQPYPKREPCGPSVEGDTPSQTESDVRSIGAASDIASGTPVLTGKNSE